MVATPLRKVGRVVSPTMLVLAGLSFLLPFATVACDTPGGFGRAAPGGTTTYTGVHLLLGTEPDVSPPEKQRPAGAGNDDRLPPQPAAIVTLALIIAGVTFAIRAQPARARRGRVATVAGLAAVALLVNQALVEAELRLRVGEQITKPLPAGKAVRDYVHTGPGFVLCLLLLVVVVLTHAIGWWRERPRPALVTQDYG